MTQTLFDHNLSLSMSTVRLRSTTFATCTTMRLVVLRPAARQLDLTCASHMAWHSCGRYNSREAELRSLRMEVDRLSGAVSSAEDDARRAADALRARLAAKQAELDETQEHLEATQVQLRTLTQVPPTICGPSMKPVVKPTTGRPTSVALLRCRIHVTCLEPQLFHVVSASSQVFLAGVSYCPTSVRCCRPRCGRRVRAWRSATSW